MMLSIAPDLGTRVRSVLCLGAHADDIEIGCAGTLLQLARHDHIDFDWVVLSAVGARSDEARQAAELIAGQPHRIRVEAFRERHFPSVFGDLKDYFDQLGRDLQPDVVFTPRSADAHQDHRLVAQLAWQTFRDHLVLEYEIPKYEGDLGQPNTYVALDDEAVEQKLTLLRDVFESQRARDWFDDQVFRGILRLRGVESRAPTGYAEAFHGSKLRLC